MLQIGSIRELPFPQKAIYVSEIQVLKFASVRGYTWLRNNGNLEHNRSDGRVKTGNRGKWLVISERCNPISE